MTTNFRPLRSRFVAALIGVTLVSGCLAPGRAVEDTPTPTAQSAALAGGRVVVVPPQGYCIETESLQARKTGGFALLASCESLTGFVSGYNVEPAVFTVTSVERQSEVHEPNASEIAVALGGASVQRQIQGDGLTIVQVTNAEPVSQGGDTKHWRGIMMLNGQMVGLALYGAKGGPHAEEAGLNLLIWLAEQIREASPVTVRETPPVSAAKNPQIVVPNLRPHSRPGEGLDVPQVPESEQNPRGGLKKLLNRMLISKGIG